jgi:hypothetical protein
MLRLLPPTLAATLVAASVAACGSSAARTTREAGPPRPAPSKFLHVDAARHVVGLLLIAGDGPSNNGFNFDDYGRGELLIKVPRGWRVTVNCTNHAALRNSCAVVSGPNATRPAFPGATTPDPSQGLASGESATFSFVASRAGLYRIASVVPGHEQARMYAVLEVTRGGRPAISARPGP